MVEGEGKLEICGGGRGDGGGLDAASLHHHSAVVVGRPVVKEDVVRAHGRCIRPIRSYPGGCSCTCFPPHP